MKKLLLSLIVFLSFTALAFANCPEGYHVCGTTSNGGVICCRTHSGGVRGELPDNAFLVASKTGGPNERAVGKANEKASFKRDDKTGKCYDLLGKEIACPDKEKKRERNAERNTERKK